MQAGPPPSERLPILCPAGVPVAASLTAPSRRIRRMREGGAGSHRGLASTTRRRVARQAVITSHGHRAVGSCACITCRPLQGPDDQTRAGRGQGRSREEAGHHDHGIAARCHGCIAASLPRLLSARPYLNMLGDVHWYHISRVWLPGAMCGHGCGVCFTVSEYPTRHPDAAGGGGALRSCGSCRPRCIAREFDRIRH